MTLSLLANWASLAWNWKSSHFLTRRRSFCAFFCSISALHSRKWKYSNAIEKKKNGTQTEPFFLPAPFAFVHSSRILVCTMFLRSTSIIQLHSIEGSEAQATCFFAPMEEMERIESFIIEHNERKRNIECTSMNWWLSQTMSHSLEKIFSDGRESFLFQLSYTNHLQCTMNFQCRLDFTLNQIFDRYFGNVFRKAEKGTRKSSCQQLSKRALKVKNLTIIHSSCKYSVIR